MGFNKVEHQAEKVVYIQKHDALIVVDVQTDFTPGGALAVPEGQSVIVPLNHTIDLFFNKGLPVFFTRDWHPPDHCSFQEHGGPWPPHCIQDTKGAEFASNLNIPKASIIISKAIANETDEYSAFKGSDKMGSRLDQILKHLRIKRIFVGGLATDYCVLNSVNDGLNLKYEVYVLTDAIRSVNIRQDDGEKALEEMKKNGAKLIITNILGVK